MDDFLANYKIDQENSLNEVRILASIQCPHIVAYKEAFYDQASKSLCVVMEYAGGGDILKKIKRYRKKQQ